MSDDCTHACCLVQEAGSSERAQRGPAPTRRALFSGHLQAAGDWPVTASRNLDAPEMGSPRSSDGGDTSSSGSSQVNWRGAAGKITQKRMQSMPACLLICVAALCCASLLPLCLLLLLLSVHAPGFQRSAHQQVLQKRR